jgi:hypothetical protein
LGAAKDRVITHPTSAASKRLEKIFVADGIPFVISDAHLDLQVAIGKIVNGTWQSSSVHFMRNALAYAGTGQPDPLRDVARVEEIIRAEGFTRVPLTA